MFKFYQDVIKVLQNGFFEGLIFGLALAIPAVAIILLNYWVVQ